MEQADDAEVHARDMQQHEQQHDHQENQEQDLQQQQEASPSEAAEASASASATASEDSVTVNLKFIHHERVSLSCSLQIGIAELKQRVVAETVPDAAEGVNVDDGDGTANLRLIYKGKVLKDDQTLASYHFQDGDTLHAVFGRPPVATATNSSTADVAAATDTTTTAGGLQNVGNGVMMGSFNIDTELGNSGMPDIGGFINSMLAGLGSAAPGAPTTISIATADPPASAASNGTTTSATVTPTTAPTTGPTVGSSSAASSTASTPDTASSASVAEQVSSIRRLMPPLDLGPLPRAPELSTDMYALGNAVRDVSDTFLAMHRQLQFLSTRLLHEHLLSERDRVRLRARVQQMVPVLHGISGLSTSVAGSLASSRYGDGSNGEAAAEATTTSHASGIPFAQPVYPTQHQGGSTGPQAPQARQTPSFGETLTDVFRALSGIAGGLADRTTPGSQTQAASTTPTPPEQYPPPPRGMDDFIRMLAPFVPSAGPEMPVASRWQPPASLGSDSGGPPTVLVRPLSAFLQEVLRMLRTATPGSREFYKDICRYFQTMFRSCATEEERKRLSREWSNKGAGEIESAMRTVLEERNLRYSVEMRRLQNFSASLIHFQEACLEVVVGQTLEEAPRGPSRPNLPVIRNLWHRVWAQLKEAIGILAEAQETPALFHAALRELMPTDDPALQTQAESLVARIAEDARGQH